MNNDTIFALSSAPGKSGVAVIRVSGNNLSSLFEHIVNKSDIKPRYAYYTNFKDDNGDLIDQCIAMFFNAPHSFTGEDVIEIYSHGAPAVIDKIFEFLRTKGARIATRGEFSKRAFYNNKMDLTGVDGLIALLNAQTDKQRQSALRSLTGNDSKTYFNWRNKMIEISAYAAAILDYDADDLPKDIDKKIVKETEQLLKELKNAVSGFRSSHTLRNGINIVLAGETNVGKSSLFNKIVGSNRAIVSDIAGTTRDVVSTQIDIDGYLINLSDTAGIRESNDLIEKIGIEKTHNEIENADIVLYVYNDVPKQINKNGITVINKSDLLENQSNKNVIYTSAKTGEGIPELLTTIKQKIHDIMSGAESRIAVNERTYEYLTLAVTELENAITKYNGNYDVFSEHVRAASDAIGKILGVITTAEIADATFSKLCLGK